MPPLAQWRGQAADAERMGAAFPALAEQLGRPESRRRVLRLMAASAALAGLAGCDDPSAADGVLIPPVRQPPGVVPGVDGAFTSVIDEGGAGAGIVVTHRGGRPVKIEGNPGHPGSLGATSAQGQAMLLDFYDPDRASGLLNVNQPSGWPALQDAALKLRGGLGHGGGLRVVTGPVASPSLARTLDGLLHDYPAARVSVWDPVTPDAGRGAALAYGRPLDLVVRPADADVILALDSDLVSGTPGHLRYAREFAARRNPARGTMSRVYAAEPVPTLIGMAADHRFIAGPAELDAALRALASGLHGGSVEGVPWVGPVLDDLRRAGRRALIHAGPTLSPPAQALVHLANERLGGRGTSFDWIEPVAWRPPDRQDDMAALVAEMQAGRVAALLILGGNPAYTCPDFAAALQRVPFSLVHAPAPDETARAATWYVPAAHDFETWGDLRAHDGTAAIAQPQALPLFGGREVFEVLALFTFAPAPGSEAAVRRSWGLDEAAWQAALASGVLAGTAATPVASAPVDAAIPLPPLAAASLRALLRPDPSLLDGRFANNPWLQELPRPLGKLVWNNPLLLAPGTAARLGLENGDEVRLEAGRIALTAPVWVQPGMAADCVLAWMGGGRTSAGEVGNGVGTDFGALRGFAGEIALHPAGRRVEIASTDHHNPLDVSREITDTIVRHATLAEFLRAPVFVEPAREPDLYRREPGGPVAWGMSIDLNACIGCNACVVACQAENNVPVVGPEQVLAGREMHWLRIDRYYEGDAADPAMLLQPVLCMHCEQAPCEPVCPVEATLHDSEGLNLQVYNRCIGTRFCSNNCPYKVRRFNYGAWAAEERRPPQARNPDVTVRSRGVMEKCTFCIQRIAATRIAADRDGTPEHAVTACQAACPTGAFSFGNLADPGSEVAARKHSPLTYVLLPEQNTKPRVTYEGRVVNRNPAIGA